MKYFLKKIKTIVRVYKQYGAHVLFKMVISKLSYKQGIDPAAKYDFINLNEFGGSFPKSVDAKTINWFIPPFSKGSGGHTTIFRCIRYLEGIGYKCNVIVIGGNLKERSPAEIRKNITDWFFALKAEVFLGHQHAPPAYYTFATSWDSAYYVKKFTATETRLYFIQDYEPLFFPMGTDYILAEETYRFGFYAVTAGDWLKGKMISDFGMTAISFTFSSDYIASIKKRSTNKSGVKNIFFYARPPTARRGFELALAILQKLSENVEHLNVVFAGWDLTEYKINFTHESHGVVNHEKLQELYFKCDVGLVLSFTNASLLPLEMMSSGLPVISNKSESNNWLLNDDCSLLLKPTVDDMVEGISRLINDRALQAKLRENGYKKVSMTSWDSAFADIPDFLESLRSDS